MFPFKIQISYWNLRVWIQSRTINLTIKIIENNFNSDLKKQLKDVTSEVIKVAGDKNLSDDLTLVGLGN